MENMIKYYYNISNIKITKKNNSFNFIYHNKLYKLINTNEYNEKDIIYYQEISNENPILDRIIPNKYGSFISNIDKQNYLLLQINNQLKKFPNLQNLQLINKQIPNSQRTINWAKLWAEKIDYLEIQINETGKKYPNLLNTLNYYIGLTENAISYYNHNVKKEEISPTICHKNLDIINFFNPLNLKVDHKSRDIAEYIKISFFLNNKNIYIELFSYFNIYYYTKNDMNILFSRVLYPSFYFKIYDEIIQGNKKDEELINLINTSSNYEKYLYQIYLFLNNYYSLEEITWLKTNLHSQP